VPKVMRQSHARHFGECAGHLNPNCSRTHECKGQLEVNFLSPADGSEIIARARTLKMSGSIGVASVEVFSKKDGTETLCAFCTATMRALDLPAEFR